MTKLYLVRHGETAFNSSQRLWGHTDVELSNLGIKQAERLRDRIALEKISFVYSSDLSRAIVTAQIIASKHKLEVMRCSELREFNYGKVEGWTLEEVIKNYPQYYNYLIDRGPHFSFPGGETPNELGARVGKFISKLKKYKPGGNLLVVVHSGVLRVIICKLMGIGIRHIYKFIPSLASISILEYRDTIAVLNLFNDTSHLNGL